jgi:hypothetical protein
MIQFRPLLGEGAAGVSVIPFFVHSEKKLSSGCVFALFGGETENLEEDARGKDDNYLVWPAPLAFAGEVAGAGLVIWTDGDSIMTVWLDGWIPFYYKTTASDESTVEQERDIALEYASQRGRSVESVFAADRADLSDEDIQSMGAKTLSGCPAYGQLDLSYKGANLLERRERLVSSLTGIGRAAVISAVALLLAAGWVYLSHSRLLEAGQSSMEEIYSAAFNESSSQPLVSAVSKLRSLRSQDVDGSFNAVMRGIASVWDNLGASDDISIDTLRFGAENLDLSGTARSNESIQHLRSMLETEGFAPRPGKIQQIPGGELRFDLTISKGGR